MNDKSIYSTISKEPIEESIIEEFDENGNLIKKKKQKKFNPYKENIETNLKENKLINFAGDEV